MMRTNVQLNNLFATLDGQIIIFFIRHRQFVDLQKDRLNKSKSHLK